MPADNPLAMCIGVLCRLHAVVEEDHVFVDCQLEVVITSEAGSELVDVC